MDAWQSTYYRWVLKNSYNGKLYFIHVLPKYWLRIWSETELFSTIAYTKNVRISWSVHEGLEICWPGYKDPLVSVHLLRCYAVVDRTTPTRVFNPPPAFKEACTDPDRHHLAISALSPLGLHNPDGRSDSLQLAKITCQDEIYSIEWSSCQYSSLTPTKILHITKQTSS